MKFRISGITFLILFSLIVAGTFFSCSNQPDVPDWSTSNSDVNGKPQGNKDNIKIDIYIDATTSMKGFATNDNTNFDKFLELAEASIGNGWKNADVAFYKFGEKARKIDRTEFLQAKNLPFYHEEGIYKQTNIDTVTNHLDNDRVSIVITDLFQKEGDLNSVVSAIKQKCLLNNLQVGIIGIKSQFDGMVLDVPKIFPYKSQDNDESTYRPFYALVFGSHANIENLFEGLQTKPFVKPENCLIISQHITNSNSVSLVKSKEYTNINNKKLNNQLPNASSYIMKSGNEAGFSGEAEIKLNPYITNYDPSKLKLIAFKKVGNSDNNSNKVDSIVTEDLSLTSAKKEGNKLKLSLKLKAVDEPGSYSYQVYLVPSPFNGLQSPQWVKEFSSDNITQNQDPNKTLNLEHFVNDLLVTNINISQPKLAKFYINILKN